MGKIKSLADGAGLSIQKQTLALKLDSEFEEMVSQIQILQSENQKLQAEVNPLKRDIEKYKDIISNLEKKLHTYTSDEREKQEKHLISQQQLADRLNNDLASSE